MSRYMVKIESIPGEATHAAHAEAIECMGFFHGLDLAVTQVGVNRTQGACRHAPIVLAHHFDKASPKLRKAAAARANLGEVTITRLGSASGAAPVEVITVSDARCVAVVSETPVRADGADVHDEMIEYFALEYDTRIKWDAKDTIGNTSLVASEVVLDADAG